MDAKTRAAIHRSPVD